MKILIQLQSALNTRWKLAPEELRQLVEIRTAQLVARITDGPIPAVSAILEEQRLPAPPEETALQKLLNGREEWHCHKCGLAWIIRGTHPNCDGQPEDMYRTTPKADA